MAGNTTRTPLLSPAPATTVAGRPSRLRPLLALPRYSASTPRKNHLRPKILKTLTKPEIAPIPPPPPPPPHAEVVLLPEEEVEVEVEVEEFFVSEALGPAPEYGGSVRRFSAMSVLKFGGYVLGVLLFQAVAAVVVTGIARTMKEDQSSYSVRGGGGGGVGEEVGMMADEEVERRVREIREMAREVRDRERKRREKVEGSDGGRVIDEEIVARLNKDKKEAGQAAGMLEGLLLDEDGGEIERSVFEKKRRFISTLSGFRSVAKGLSGLSGGNGSDPGDDLMRKDAGALQEASGTSLPVEVGKTPDLSNAEGRRYPKGEIKSSQHITSVADSVNGTKVRDSTMSKEEASDARVKQADVPTDMWWFKLPYVLAILMRRGPQEDKTGLFVLRLNSTAAGEQGAACTLAFEDRSDANNFCNLLESYFEGLDNFSADIVPLTTKELQDSVKSQREKVLVVKKGQIKLYAGQPFADVESTLRSLL